MSLMLLMLMLIMVMLALGVVWVDYKWIPGRLTPARFALLLRHYVFKGSKVNKLFPGLPNYSGPTKGVFGMLHHDQLYEYSSDVKRRVWYVLSAKPSRELETRLRHMVYIRPAYYKDGCREIKWIETDEKIWSYIKQNIPDCQWRGGFLDFSRSK